MRKVVLILTIQLICNLAFTQAETRQNQEKLSICLFEYSDYMQSSNYYDDFVGEISNPEGIVEYDFEATDYNWQIGFPNKGDWTQGCSPQLPEIGSTVLITDTINTYPINNVSVVLYHIRKPQWAIDQNRCWSYFMFQFMYKCETDTLEDGLEIEVSFDGGINFVNAMDSISLLNIDNPPLYIDGDFADFPGDGKIFGISGTFIPGSTTDWGKYYLECAWDYNISNISTDYAIVRLTFKSDGNDTGKRGIMIDNVYTGVVDLCNPIVVGQESFDEITIYPNPTAGIINIASAIDTELSISIVNMLGHEVYCDSIKFKKQIDCSHLKKGVYYYCISDGKIVAKFGKIVLI